MGFLAEGGSRLHGNKTVRRRLLMTATMCDDVTAPDVLFGGSVDPGPLPPALGTEPLPRRVPIVATGVLTQQLLLGNSDPSLFIRTWPHCRAFLTNLSYWTDEIVKCRSPEVLISLVSCTSVTSYCEESVKVFWSEYWITTLRCLSYNSLRTVHTYIFIYRHIDSTNKHEFVICWPWANLANSVTDWRSADGITGCGALG